MTANESRRPRLVVVVSSDRRRGAEVFGEALATGLADRGWDTRLLALSGTGVPPRVEAELVAPVVPADLGKLDRAVVVGLRRRLSMWPCDVVLAYGGPAVQYATATVRTMRNRPRLVVASIGDPMFWIRSRAHARLRAIVLAGADRIFSVSAATAVPLVEELGVDPARIRIAPTGVGESFFSIAPTRRGEALRVVVIGALSTEKDPLAAVEVVAALSATTPVELRLVGDGPLAAEVAAAVDAAGIGRQTSLAGSVADVSPHLAWADVLLQTSRSEGLPGVVLEAAAAGVPSVVYGVGGAGEAVVDGETGSVIAPGDRAGAIAAIAALADDRELARRMGERARERAVAHYRLETALDRYHELLTDELAAAPDRAGRQVTESGGARRPVKVAHLTTVDLSLRYLVLPQMTAAGRLGWEAIGISAPGPYVAEVEAAGVRHIALPTSSRGWGLRRDLGAARDLWKILRAEQVDILHTHNPKPGLYGRILGRLAGVPVVVNTVHGLYATEDDSAAKRAAVYLVEGVASRFSDAELVQSVEDLQLMTRYHITRRHRTALLGNGVDLDRFDPARFTPEEREQARAELGASADRIVVGSVGRLVAEKGYPELVEAAERLPDRYLVVAVGPDDPDKPDALGPGFSARAAEAGVRLLGMRTDVDRLYAAMDVFVLASHREGFPRAAMEAAAMGLPVVATDIRGCRQVVDDGVNGRLVPVGDAVALADAIASVGDDPAVRAAMGEASRAKARAEFDENRVVHTVYSTYHAVALRKGVDRVLAAAPPPEAPVVRVATLADVPHLARLHGEAIDTGFLPRLGAGVMERLYTALVGWDDAVVLVADGAWRPVGFVAGVVDTAAFYRHFFRSHGAGAALSALPRLIRPSVLRRAWETLRYGGDDDHGFPAELLSMAVDYQVRRRGLGGALGEAFLAAIRDRGVPGVRVVVAARNQGAIAAYERLGFTGVDTIEVHEGEPSLVMTWSPR